MRWITPEPPTEGDTRIVKRFAFLPITIGRENRWLEVCYIQQEFKLRYFEWDWEGFYDNTWVDERFVDKYDYELHRRA